MAGQLATRQRLVARYGRPLTLRRTGQTDLPITAVLTAYRPEQTPPQGAVRQGDAQVAMLNTEIAAASWPAPIRSQDQLVVDGKTWAVMGAAPVYSGAVLIGWNLWARGGQT